MKSLILICLLSFVLLNCASYTQETAKIRSLFLNKNFSEALSELEQSSLKQDSKSRLLYLLEKAMIYDRLGEKEKFRRTLLDADKVVDRLFTTSVINTVSTLIINESSSDYRGENYEQVALHVLLALSFLEEDQLNEARISAKKINERLYAITQDLGDRNNSYREDAFARYLAGIIYELNGEYDDAIIDYKKALKIYEASSYKRFYQPGVLPQVAEALYRLAKLRNRQSILSQLEKNYPKLTKPALSETDKDAQIIVFHEIGHTSVKKTREFLINVGKQIVRFSFPFVSKSKAFQYGPTGLSLDDGKFLQANNTVDMNSLAHYSLEERRLRLVAKGIGRILLKSQLTRKVHDEFGPLAGILANVAVAATETADTRGWTLLPESFWCTRVRVKSGRHKITIKTNGLVNEIIDVNIPPNGYLVYRVWSS